MVGAVSRTPGATAKGVATRETFTHEMGHLLLPYGSHTSSGLMKSGWDRHQAVLAVTGNLIFVPAQAATIRARLSNFEGMLAQR